MSRTDFDDPTHPEGMIQLTRDRLLALHLVGIVVCGGRPRQKTEVYVTAIRRAFSGGSDSELPAYTASRKDLGVKIREIYAGASGFDAFVADSVMARAPQSLLLLAEQPIGAVGTSPALT